MAARPLKVWITRAEPGASRTAEQVRALGHEAFVAPLLQVRPLAGAGADLAGVGALAFTSANGVRAFAALSSERDLPVFAVGAATAAAARAAGFTHISSGEGDVAALAEAIAARRGDLAGAVLHPAPVEPAGDLVGDLSARGVPARAAAIYDTVPVPPTPELTARLRELDVVLLHSPKAARALAELLAAHPAPHLRALGLSAAVLEPLAQTALASQDHPPMPLESALLNLLER